MLKDIRSGFSFGIGFAIATLIIYYGFSFLYTQFMFPGTFSPTMSDEEVAEFNKSYEEFYGEKLRATDFVEGFNEMSIDEQIQHSSMIVAGRYIKNDEGLYEAIVEDVLKNSGVKGYKPGDIADEASTYSLSSYTDNSQRFLIFYTGGSESRKPRMQMSMTFSGDRIGGLKSIPYELFKSKCENASKPNS